MVLVCFGIPMKLSLQNCDHPNRLLHHHQGSCDGSVGSVIFSKTSSKNFGAWKVPQFRSTGPPPGPLQLQCALWDTLVSSPIRKIRNFLQERSTWMQRACFCFLVRNMQKPIKKPKFWQILAILGMETSLFLGRTQKKPLQFRAAQRHLRHKVSPAYQSSGQLPWWLIRCLATSATTETGENGKGLEVSPRVHGRREKKESFRIFRPSCFWCLTCCTFHSISYHVIARQGHCKMVRTATLQAFYSNSACGASIVDGLEVFHERKPHKNSKFYHATYVLGPGALSQSSFHKHFHLGPSFEPLRSFPPFLLTSTKCLNKNPGKSQLKPRWVDWLSKFPEELLVLRLQGEATPLVARGGDNASERSPTIVRNKSYGFLKQATKTTKVVWFFFKFIHHHSFYHTKSILPRRKPWNLVVFPSSSLVLIWFMKCVSRPRIKKPYRYPDSGPFMIPWEHNQL